MPIAVLHQQMSTDQIRETRARLKTIVSGHRVAWSKFRPSEEIAHLVKRSAILQCQTYQAGDPNLLCDVISAVE